jgi:riboflavin kinase
MTLRGVLSSGLGRGAEFMVIDWVREGLERFAGFVPYPGTLNLTLLPDDVAQWRAVRARDASMLLPPVPDACGARVVRAVIAPDLAAAIVVPDITAHPDDVIEVVAAIHVRSRLGLRDGDVLTLTVA